MHLVFVAVHMHANQIQLEYLLETFYVFGNHTEISDKL